MPPSSTRRSPERATTAMDYGYGSAVPDSEMERPRRIQPRRSSSSSSSSSKRWDDTTDVEMKDVTPLAPVKKASMNNSADMYGYGDAAPDSNEHGPSSSNNQFRTPMRQARRSSMKSGRGSSRRASIGYTGEITIQLPGKSKPVRRRTSISFASEDEVCEVTPAKDMSPTQNLWFSNEESSAIREKCSFLVELMRASESHPDAREAIRHYNIRGLESHVEPGPSVEQDQAWYSVFLEQYLQRNEGVFDDTVISQAYQRNTFQSQQIAQDRAQQDAQEIQTYTKSVRRQMRRMSLM